VPAAVAYAAGTRTATLDPTAPLASGTAYTASLVGGAAAIRDGAGNPLANDAWSFTTAAASTSQTATFDDKAGQDQPLNGQYPSGVIDWGSGKWYHAGPYGAFASKSISFEGGGVTSRTFAFVTARRLESLRAYNGGGAATTVTVACNGQTKTQAVPAGQAATLSTGFAAACTTVTLTSSNGWDTNFDDLVHDAG
jgi:hypothetical protein